MARQPPLGQHRHGQEDDRLNLSGGRESRLGLPPHSRRGSPRLAHGTDQAGSRGQLRADGLRRVPHPPGGQGPARRQGQVHRRVPADRSQILKEPCT